MVKNLTNKLAVPIVTGVLITGCGGGSGENYSQEPIDELPPVQSVLSLGEAKGVISSYLANSQFDKKVSYSDGLNASLNYEGKIHVVGNDMFGRTHCMSYGVDVPTFEFLVSKDCDNITVISQGNNKEISELVMNETSKNLYPRLSERRNFKGGDKVVGELLTRDAEHVSCSNEQNEQLVPFTYIGDLDGEQVWTGDMTFNSNPGFNSYNCNLSNRKGTSKFTNAAQSNLENGSNFVAEITFTGNNASFTHNSQVHRNFRVSCSLPAGIDPYSYGLEAKLLADGSVIASDEDGVLDKNYIRVTPGITNLQGACSIYFGLEKLSTTISPNSFTYRVNPASTVAPTPAPTVAPTPAPNCGGQH